ncbi:hypothetical protein CPC16_007251 [Podila verticillata]|nr:hypothetical protein BGZ52_011383 [Haplosporangium bisporale]KAF9213251.1 hypothetical protein BGZ59_005652 [Podila verticillata]KAF9387071.1 hypothetical protein CPC16_007251 [Podila verticillata]KAI9241172.1 MAG: hypothetical protein BYD32DRAFT_85360 [Podila humilis]KFH68828.1 hypothetical protein MVEG_05632 [Podila verticillata NRRL 6337]
MTVETPKEEVVLDKEEVTPSTATATAEDDLDPSDAIVAIGNDVLANGPSATLTPGANTPSGTATPSEADEEKFSFKDGEENEDVFQDAMEDLPATRKLHHRLSTYSPQVRETEEWEQIMQDWERVMAEKRIQDARLNLVEQENKRMKAQLTESESARAELEKESRDKIQELEKANKELAAKMKDPAKEKKALMNQLEESEAEKDLFKLMLEETESEKKRIELKFAQLDRDKDLWVQKYEKVKALKNRLRLKAAQFELLSTSTSSLLLRAGQGLEGAHPDKERRRLMDQVTSLESDRSRLAALVKDTMSSDNVTSTTGGASTPSKELSGENKRLGQELEMVKVERSLLQRRIEALEVTLHDVRVALAGSESHAESLEAKKYDLQDKLNATEGSLDRARIDLTKYQGLHKEMLEKNDKLDRELQVIKARFEAKDRVLITTQKQLTAAKVDGGLLKTIRRELESVLFDYNTVVQHFMDIQVQAIGAKSLANALKRQVNELQAQLTHYRTMLLGIKSFNNNDPIKSPTVTTLRSEFRVLLEKIQEEQNTQVDKERADKFKAQDWNRKLRMEKDFMKLELQNQIEKWRRVSVYWEDKWRKTANDLHEAVTTGTTSEMLFEAASAPGALHGTASSSNAASPRTSDIPKRRSLAITTTGTANVSTQDQPLTPSAMKQHILENKMRTNSTISRQTSSSLFLSSAALPSSTSTPVPVTSISSSSSSPAQSTSSSITDSISDLVKPFLGRSLSGSGSSNSSLVGGVGTGRGSASPSSRLAAAATLRTPIAAGLPSNVTGVGAMGNTSVSKTSLRSRSMATSAIGTARSQALQAGVSGAVVTVASKEAQTRANASISTTAKSVDQALSESDRLKAEVHMMLNRSTR